MAQVRDSHYIPTHTARHSMRAAGDSDPVAARVTDLLTKTPLGMVQSRRPVKAVLECFVYGVI